MTLPDVQRVFDYWQRSPPEHELLAIAVRVYTTWEPEPVDPLSNPAAHRAALEAQWKAGAFGPEDLWLQAQRAKSGKVTLGKEGSVNGQ